jgi:hypothetical protein
LVGKESSTDVVHTRPLHDQIFCYLSAIVFNPQNLIDSFLALCGIDQGWALTLTFHFALLGADYSKYFGGTRSNPNGHDGAKGKDNTDKQCLQDKLVAAQWRARGRGYMELLTHFSPQIRKSCPKIPGVPRTSTVPTGYPYGALHRRGRNPSNHQWLPHVMEHIPSYVQQPVCGDRTAVSKPHFFCSRRPRDAQNATAIAAGNSRVPKAPSYRHPLRQQGRLPLYLRRAGSPAREVQERCIPTLQRGRGDVMEVKGSHIVNSCDVTELPKNLRR